MNFCKSCFYPDTKPDLAFNDSGFCAACISFKKREKIDWKKREEKFLEVVNQIKKDRNSEYDCIIPVSGGKDSTYQVIKGLDYGLKILCVNSRTCSLTPIGRENLDNIKNLGVDMMELAPNPIVRKKLNKLCLKEVGDISWPEHISIFTLPIKIALKLNIKLIVWGENSQNEYGGPLESLENTTLNRGWLEEFGGLLGLRLSDLIDHYGFDKRDLEFYKYPDPKKISESKIQSLFFGYFFPWDGHRNAIVSQKKGFKFHDNIVEGTGVKYENLDNYQTGIHDYFKYLKYGFGRTTDIMNNLYRRNLISKSEAYNNIKKYDGNFPSTYLGKKIEDILKDIDLNINEFEKICDKFTNKKIFKCSNEGKILKKNFSPIKNF